MNKIAKWLAAAVMTAIESAAIAQDTQFNVMGQFQGGGTFSGDLMINTVTGSFDSASVTVASLPNINVSLIPYLPLSLATFDGTYAGSGSASYAGVLTYEELFGAGAVLTLFEPVSSLVGYSGGNLAVGFPVDGTPIYGYLGFGIPTNTAHQMSGGSLIISGSVTAVPEIDSASAAGGLTLLLGSMLVLRGRRSGAALAA
jgi:hypothetical protein